PKPTPHTRPTRAHQRGACHGLLSPRRDRARQGRLLHGAAPLPRSPRYQPAPRTFTDRARSARRLITSAANARAFASTATQADVFFRGEQAEPSGVAKLRQLTRVKRVEHRAVRLI